MSNRFTQRAQQVIFLAEQIAKNLYCPQVDTGHLLWGLLREGDGVAYGVLAALGVEQGQLEQQLPRGNAQAVASLEEMCIRDRPIICYASYASVESYKIKMLR